MTTFRKFGALLLPMTALSLSALGLASGHAAEGEADTAPRMQCAIEITKVDFGHAYTGVLTSDTAIAGHYELNLTQRGGTSAVINQSGPFEAKAGVAQTVGKAVFGGVRPQNVDASLILHIGDQTYVCGSQTDI